MGNVPAAVSTSELEGVRLALRHGLRIEPCDGLTEGDQVRVTKGPLAGVEGIFLRDRGSDRLVLEVSLIQRSATVEIDRLYVEPVSTSAPGHGCSRVHPGREQRQ